MIKETRLIDEFVELIKVSSPSKQEKELGELVHRKLKNLGADVFTDKSGEKVGGTCNNIIGKIGGDPKLLSVILNAHLDTVIPCKNIKPIMESGVIKSDGSTILGADDKSGVAIILEVIRVLQETKAKHPPLEIVFTICEEIGLLGAKNLDFSLLKSKYGYSLDTEQVDSIVTSAPSHNKLFFMVYGVESHAGGEPEKGISAIEVASEAIYLLSSTGKLGKIDEITTANIGKINGGLATNIVAPYVEVEGETRSHSNEKLDKITNEIVNCFQESAKKREKVIDGEKKVGRVEEKVHQEYSSFSLSDNCEVVNKAVTSAKNIGITPKLKKSGGGSDANIFNANGIQTAIIGTGMQKVHTKQEYIKTKDLVLCAKLLLKILTSY